MAFVSGLMGPYMSPIPINASMGMLLSLAIAFIVTPWLAQHWMKASGHNTHAPKGLAARLHPLFERVFRPLLDARRGGRNRPTSKHMPERQRRSTSTASCASITCARAAKWVTCR